MGRYFYSLGIQNNRHQNLKNFRLPYFFCSLFSDNRQKCSNAFYFNLLKLNICFFVIDVCKYNCISLIIHANHIQCVYTVHLVPSNYFQHCEYISAHYHLYYSYYLYHMINFRDLFTITMLPFIFANFFPSMIVCITGH